MEKAFIYITAVVLSTSSDSVELTARLISGTVVSGMFLRIPLSKTFHVAIPIHQVTPTADGGIRLVLDCEKDAEIAAMVLDFNFADETLQVTEDGEL